jgi:hypothetical protein
VTRATGSPTASFAGVVDGHVSLFDSTTGRQLRQLTYPPAGKADRYARWSTGALVWIRDAGSGCGGEVDRLEGGSASTLVKSTRVQYGSAALSPSGAWVAWTEIPCAGGDPGDVVVSGGGAPARRLAIPSGTDLELYDVTDDGALLLRTNDKAATGPGAIGIVPAGALTVAGAKPLATASGCYLASGAAFLGSTPVAFETCGEKARLVRFTTTGSRAGADQALTEPSPLGVTARGSEVLVWRGDSSIATYRDGRFTTVLHNAGCTGSGDQKGCVRSPDW